MALTVEQVEAQVVGLIGGFLGACGLSVATDGTNPDIAVALTAALYSLSYGVSSPADLPTDLQPIPDSRAGLMLGVTRLYALRNCLGHYLKVDETAGTDRQAFDQLRQALLKAIADLEAELAALYGYPSRRQRSRTAPITKGGPDQWPPLPPPPSSVGPWPPGSRVGGTSGNPGGFNP